MSAGDWVALGAAIVALGAMAVAIWQAREARGSRKATEQQATEATKAREVAEEALALSRQAEADRRADREAKQYAMDAPEFSVDWHINMGDDEVILDVRMNRGPDLAYVEFSAVGPNVRGVSSPLGSTTGAPALRWDNVGVQDAIQVRLDTNDPNESVHATLRLHSVERTGGRHWTWEYQFTDAV